LLFCISFLQTGIYAENNGVTQAENITQSENINQSNIKATLKKVADWQIENIKYSLQGLQVICTTMASTHGQTQSSFPECWNGLK